MREIWETPFGNAVLKVERANKHIADIEERIRSSTDAYSAHIYTNRESGEQFLDYGLTDRFFRSDIALMTGDAIHNLKCALDFAWVDIIKRLYPKSYGRWTKFPVESSRNRLESALTSQREITRNSAIFKFMTEGVKSYEGGDGDLDICALHRLDKDDKHELLIPVLNVAAVDGLELENEAGEIDTITFGSLTRSNPYTIPVTFGSKIKNHGKITTQITFREGTFPDNLEVVPTLRRLSMKTEKIVRLLQRMR